jgi:hypothetical protein
MAEMTTAEKLSKVYEGVERVEGLNEELEKTLYGTDTGGKSFYDAFWDAYQDNGNRTHYNTAFAGYGWTDETFKPKYDIKPTDANRLFSHTAITDLKAALEKAGVVFDLSKATSAVYLFESGSLTHIPEINTTSLSDLQYFIYSVINLVTVDKVILKNDGSQTFGAQSFGTLLNLEEIRFEGVIGKNGFNMNRSTKLSKASITSIINALSTTTSGLTVTLSKVAVNTAFETSAGANNGEQSAEWLALKATKSNWEISLV